MRGRKEAIMSLCPMPGEQSGSEDIRGSAGICLDPESRWEPRKGFEQVLMGPGFSFRRAERKE